MILLKAPLVMAGRPVRHSLGEGGKASNSAAVSACNRYSVAIDSGIVSLIPSRTFI